MAGEPRKARAAAAPATEVRVLRSREALDAIADRWTQLESQSAGLTLFQGLGWARAVFDFEAARGNAGFDPVIVAIDDGCRVTALLPLERIRTGTRTVLVPLGHAFGQYADALMAEGVEPKGAIACMLKAAVHMAPCDTVSFLKVREGSALARGLPSNHVVTGAVQGAPFVALDGFETYAAYFQTIKSKTRKNMRNARNRLEREGPVEHQVMLDAAGMSGVIERTLAGRAERLKDQGLTSRAFRDAGFTEFCQSLVGRVDIDLMAFSFTHVGQPIAEQWGFVHRGRYYAFVASRDFSNSEESPGKLHLGEVIHAAAEAGLKGCDLGVPAMPYKLTWATETVSVSDYALPMTLKGLFMIRLWDVWLRPALKAGVLKMPPALRARMLRLVGHGH